MDSAFPSSVIFCSSCILMLPSICWVNFSIPFFTSPTATITTGIVMAFIPHIRSISISRALYFDSFSVTFTEVFLSVGMDMSMSRQLFFFFILDDDVWSVGLYLTICLYWHIPQDCDIVIFCYRLGLMLVPFFFCVNVEFFQCRYVAALLCLRRYSVLANSGHPATTWSMVSWN